MSRVYLDFKNGTWKEVDKSDFWIDNALLIKLKALKMIQSKGWDGVIIIDGMERAGKSVLAMICGWYLSNTKLTEKNFVRGLQDAGKRIAELPDKSILIIDEGSTVFSSKDSASSMQKSLIKILDVVGQKNLIFIICLPCFFDLNKTIAVRRSKFLIHVYPDEKYNRGSYAFWGEKAKPILYRHGKKNFDSYAFPRAEFIGQYFNFHPPFYENYLESIKKESLQQVLKGIVKKEPTSIAIHNLKIETAGRLKEILPKVTYETIAEIFQSKKTTVSDWIQAYKKVKNEEKAEKFAHFTSES